MFDFWFYLRINSGALWEMDIVLAGIKIGRPEIEL
jgi:hypothetical protein